MKQWYVYETYDIVHPNVSKLLSKMQKYSNIIHKCQFCTMSHPEGGVHLTKISLLPVVTYEGFHLSCNITSPMIYSNHSQT